MSPKVRTRLFEGFVLLGCAAVLLTALFAIFRTSDGGWAAGGDAELKEGATGSSLRSSIDDGTEGTGGAVGTSDTPPMQIRIRSPQAAPDLTNDAEGPLFVETNMAPGTTSTRCVAVSNAGLQLADIRLFSTMRDSGLGSSVSFLIEAGTGGAYGDCAGFKGVEIFRGTLSELTSKHRNYATGLRAPETVYPDESVSYRLTQRLDTTSPQGAAAQARFGWESHGAGAPSPLDGRDPLVRQRPLDPTVRRPHAVGRSVAQAVLETAKDIAKKGWAWIGLLGLVVLYLLVQDRIDRRDPRLAGALVHPEPDLPFNEHLSRSTRTSEART
jgi:hypothetical protein